MKVTALAHAKLNLTLDVLEKRPDGYHDISSVFQSISLFDKLEVTRTEKDILINTDSEIAPEDNICVRAARLFFDATKLSGGAEILLQKNIPIAAGLGGGSADGAATLKALNLLYKSPLSDKELLLLSAKLGADVPFCLFGGTAHATGIGEKLIKLPDLPCCDIIIIKNAGKPSTAELYKRLDECEIPNRPDTDAAVLAIKQGDLKNACDNFSNVFSCAWGDTLKAIENDLKAQGAYTACLSGSGPTVYGIFKKGEGEKALVTLKETYADIHLCTPHASPGVEIIE